MIKLLYIHGYNKDNINGVYGQTYHLLKEQCGDKYELHAVDYDADKPVKAIRDIADYVKDNKIDCVIGSSLGGFLTMNVFGPARIVVNPCWNPSVELPKIGYDGPVEDYEILLSTLKESVDFEESNLCAGVFASDDELLGTKYIKEFNKYFNDIYHVEGHHRIDKNMAKTIID